MDNFSDMLTLEGAGGQTDDIYDCYDFWKISYFYSKYAKNAMFPAENYRTDKLRQISSLPCTLSRCNILYIGYKYYS